MYQEKVARDVEIMQERVAEKSFCVKNDMETSQSSVTDSLQNLDCVSTLVSNENKPSSRDDHDDDIDEHVINSPSLTPMRIVARVIDNYLAEVAADVNLKASKFQNLAEALPSYARISHDGFYRAIDIYLKVCFL